MSYTKKLSYNFNLGEVTQKRYQLFARTLFPSFFQQNQNYQPVTWPPYDVILEFAINSTAKTVTK